MIDQTQTSNNKIAEYVIDKTQTSNNKIAEYLIDKTQTSNNEIAEYVYIRHQHVLRMFDTFTYVTGVTLSTLSSMPQG